MNIPYMQTTYLMVSKKMNPCVRPLVMNIYNCMPTLTSQEGEEGEECEYSLEAGTSLWELYMNLGRLHQWVILLGVHQTPFIKVGSTDTQDW